MPEKKDETVKLTEAIESLDEHVEVMIENDHFWRTFVKGIVAALGAAIGATIVLGLLVYILQSLTGVPFVGHYFNQIIQTIQQSQ